MILIKTRYGVNSRNIINLVVMGVYYFTYIENMKKIDLN